MLRHLNTYYQSQNTSNLWWWIKVNICGPRINWITARALVQSIKCIFHSFHFGPLGRSENLWKTRSCMFPKIEPIISRSNMSYDAFLVVSSGGPKHEKTSHSKAAYKFYGAILLPFPYWECQSFSFFEFLFCRRKAFHEKKYIQLCRKILHKNCSFRVEKRLQNQMTGGKLFFHSCELRRHTFSALISVFHRRSFSVLDFWSDAHTREFMYNDLALFFGAYITLIYEKMSFIYAALFVFVLNGFTCTHIQPFPQHEGNTPIEHASSTNYANENIPYCMQKALKTLLSL